MRDIHILGVCGTFMGGIAVLAKQLGFQVTGSDRQVYPPMSTMLSSKGIEIMPDENQEVITAMDAQFVVGNVIARGNPIMEELLNRSADYISGPQWLYENILRDRWVLAVSGTHGKSTTASMLAWILEYAGLNPGFLIGGVPANFGVSARLGETPFFVIEADEYDTAFFDKRSKFVHFRPKTLIINNLEFDHADIFENLDAIKRQFHHLVRTVPGQGLIVANQSDANVQSVLDQGCWSDVEGFSSKQSQSGWHYEVLNGGGQHWQAYLNNVAQGDLRWGQLGLHNVSNALAAMAAARHVGVPPSVALEALAKFKGIKRRMEFVGESKTGVKIYDDFAHHPTAIQITVAGLRAHVASHQRIVAIFEPRSNSMRMGVHQDSLPKAFQETDEVWLYQPLDMGWEMDSLLASLPQAKCFDSIDAIVAHAQAHTGAQDYLLVMSNGSFGNIQQRLLEAL